MVRAALFLSGALSGTLPAAFIGGPVLACETALLLAVDVSGSISNEEYVLQMEGLADALQDAAVLKALVAGQDQIALMHWSGLRKQRLSIPWTKIETPEDVAALAQAVRASKRPKDHTDTAIGEALFFSLAQFSPAPDCARLIIDLSGDGAENAGGTLARARDAVERAGIVLNGIAIEENAEKTALTEYFRQFVISRGGFVMTARGLQDYPRAIRAKLLRELTPASS